ncbi:MAG TPA: cytochrome c family protein [Hyphomonas sp.]|nr:cytochrome c family protein [Hyphomonas sp.]
MGELGLNKILGALLATALGLFGLKALSDAVFSSGGEGHHATEEAEATSLSEQMCKEFAYCVEVAGGGGGAAQEEEKVFDLGAELAAADASRGERVFKGQCTTCHTIDDGGPNATGPNLHGVVDRPKASHPGFSYSAALSGVGGNWTYEDLNHWLTNPGAYARGTSMSFAGLRKDADRMNVIAYLASQTPNAPPYPAPLAAGSSDAAPADAAPAEGEAAPAEGGEAAAPAETAPAGGMADAAAGTVQEAAAAVTDAASDAAGAVTDAASDAVDAASGAVSDAAAAATDAASDATEDVTDGQ